MKPYELDFLRPVVNPWPLRVLMMVAVLALLAACIAVAHAYQRWLLSAAVSQVSATRPISVLDASTPSKVISASREAVTGALAASGTELSDALAALENSKTPGIQVQSLSYAATNFRLQATLQVRDEEAAQSFLASQLALPSRWRLEAILGGEAEAPNPGQVSLPPEDLFPLQLPRTRHTSARRLNIRLTW